MSVKWLFNKVLISSHVERFLELTGLEACLVILIEICKITRMI